MYSDYMFAVQEISINPIYISPTIKEESYTLLKMSAGFFKTPISSEVLKLS